MWQTEIFIKQHIFETVNPIGDLLNKDLYYTKLKVTYLGSLLLEFECFEKLFCHTKHN